jgi:hypothetical protein
MTLKMPRKVGTPSLLSPFHCSHFVKLFMAFSFFLFFFLIKGSVRVAAYDSNAKSIRYTPYELVIRPAMKQEMVEVSDAREAVRWMNGAGEYGCPEVNFHHFLIFNFQFLIFNF